MTFAICMSSSSYFIHFFAHRALERDAELLLTYFHSSLSEAHTLLSRVKKDGLYKCSDTLERSLETYEFESSSVRWLGVVDEDNNLCASDPNNVDLNTDQVHDLQDGYTLVSAEYKNNQGRDLLLLNSAGKTRFYASLDLVRAENVLGFDCERCLEYTLQVVGSPEPLFEQHVLESEPVVELSTLIHEEPIDLRLTIRGSTNFFQHYKTVGWEFAALFSTIISISIASLAYFLLRRRQSFERVLQDAIRAKEFVPFYQPIINSKTGHVAGAEVLVRWIRRDGSSVPPNEFINFAEKSGLIIPMTELLLKQVGHDLAAFGWQGSPYYASINIVPEHLQSNTFYEKVEEVINKNSLRPENIALEITERRRIVDLKQARQVLDRFYALGIKLKLDDAGTGYGGFSYIQELGISSLKIDKMFIDSILAIEDFKTPVLDSIINFAQSSDLEIIAEGVETPEQIEYLNKRDVSLIQGFVFAKPMPASDMANWLQISVS